jgi:hypothetical protein
VVAVVVVMVSLLLAVAEVVLVGIKLVQLLYLYQPLTRLLLALAVLVERVDLFLEDKDLALLLEH